MTGEGDLVLVHVDGNPAFFARVEDISADPKPNWFQVKLLVLQVPLVVVTWILREAYIAGEEFTMGGHPMRLEKVVAPEDGRSRETPSEGPAEKMQDDVSTSGLQQKGKVVSLFERRKGGDQTS